MFAANARVSSPGKRFFFALLLVVLCLTLPGAAADDGLGSVLSLGRGVRGLRVPIGDDPARPVAIVTCQEVKLKGRQFGPFTLGLLPQIVVEGTQIQIQSTAAAPEFLIALRSLFRQEDVFSSAIFAGLTILRATGEPIVVAQLAMFHPGRNTLIMSNVRISNSSGNPFLHSAELPFSAGEKQALRLITSSQEFKILLP
jgi:hypothetical protein